VRIGYRVRFWPGVSDLSTLTVTESAASDFNCVITSLESWRMLTILRGTSSQLKFGVETDLAVYRHKVFVEGLGWRLPLLETGVERDQFDRPDTLYVIAKDDFGQICGCARLLPTTRPYLLDSVFSQLMGDTPCPRAAEIWELSRYATQTVPGAPPLSREELRARFCALLKAVVETALDCGAERLITFTGVGVERIAKIVGIHVHRAAPPQRVDGKPVVAMWIELDEQTRKALGVSVGNAEKVLH
jgi:acyl homoserine lactone synthase